MIRRLPALLLPLLLLAQPAAAQTLNDLVDAGRYEEAYARAEAESAAGDAEATETLAWLLEQGQGTAEDDVRAVRLYEQGADAGRSFSQWRLGVMLDLGEGVSPDPRRALRLFLAAATQGNAQAYGSLGVMYATGRGTKQDFAKARWAYVEAARRGEAQGYFGVGVLHAGGEGVAQDSFEAAAWFLLASLHGQDGADAALEEMLAELGQVDRARLDARAVAIEKDVTGQAPPGMSGAQAATPRPNT